jgi:hypothetical protein
MTNAALEQLSTPRPATVVATASQATAVEQQRAIAEVQAAVVVAQQCPRSLDEAIRQMKESCAQAALADMAFFRYPRAGQQITGPSVHLARELARCWGNVQYGISELRRDDAAHVSEMIAWAWDVQTNTRSSSSFIVPHETDTKQGRKKLNDLRDVYENNANQGARRVREAIFAILPVWFTTQAKDLCNATITNGGTEPLAAQVAAMIGNFEALGITKKQLEAKLGRPSGEWVPQDLAQLRVIGGSINRGEVSKDDEFATHRVTVAEIKQTPAPAFPGDGGPPEGEGAGQPPEPSGGGDPGEEMTDRTRGRMFALFTEQGITDRAEQIRGITHIIGREIESRSQITDAEGCAVIAQLEKRSQS